MRIPLPWILTIAVLPALAGCSMFNKQNQVADSKSKADSVPDPEKIKPAPAPRINPRTHIAAGQMLEKQGDLRAAIEQYEKAVAADPKSPAGYNRLGITYQKMGDVAEAERMFLRGLQQNPSSTTLLNNLGYCQLAQQRYVDAERNFRRAVECSPDFKRARMNLAIVLAQQGRGDESLTQFAMVVPQDTAHVNLAVIAMQKGDYATSEENLRKALAITPDYPGARRYLDRVSKLAQAPPAAEPPAQVSPGVKVAGAGAEDPPQEP